MRIARHLVAHVLVVSLGGCAGSYSTADAAVDAGGTGGDSSAPDGGADAGPATNDAATADSATPTDSGPRADAGPREACAPDDATVIECPSALCDGPSSWHWNGDTCVAFDCGTCTGADCGFQTEAQCRTAHAQCVPSLCRATGGRWLWWAEECGDFVCGTPPLQNCLVGRPVCDCGPSKRFEPGVGCVADPSCPSPPARTRQALCLATGGTWSNTCCDSVCGQACALACAADACTCGPFETFDAERGCIDAVRCHERLNGESCDGPARCASGTICCRRCGGAGCFMPTCKPAVCDSDPATDVCGNRNDAA